MTDLTLYRCESEGCHLGSRTEPGHFTAGITAEQANMLTGKSVDDMVEGTDYGEGVCPNCGKPGTDTGETHESVEGSDPNEAAHVEIARRIADPADKLKPKEAQKAFEKLLEGGDDDE